MNLDWSDPLVGAVLVLLFSVFALVLSYRDDWLEKLARHQPGWTTQKSSSEFDWWYPPSMRADGRKHWLWWFFRAVVAVVGLTSLFALIGSAFGFVSS